MSFDLERAALAWLADAGFEADFSPAALAEAERAALPAALPEGVRDERGLLWSSVDNEDSRDLDQLEVAERLDGGDILLRVAIADVDALLPRGGAAEARAAKNTTSVYGGIAIWPMLPELLSCEKTSLLEGQDRLAVVVALRVNPDGTLQHSEIYRALVRNHARLDYDSVGTWLDGHDAPTQLAHALARVPGLAEQLKLQDECADRFLELRRKCGALELGTMEARPVVKEGKIVDLAVVARSQSRSLIENIMIAANAATVAFLRERGFPTLQRIVRTPRRWERLVALARESGGELPQAPHPKALADFLTDARRRDPDGFPELSLAVVKLLGPGEYACIGAAQADVPHFGLAVSGYTHSTAPNRRWPDVITQRLVKAALVGAAPPYSEPELEAIAARCTEMANMANKVERRLRKAAAAQLLAGKTGEIFDAIVTGASKEGVYCRLLSLPAEGRIVRGEERLDVGLRIRVRLLGADPARGFIDFAAL